MKGRGEDVILWIMEWGSILQIQNNGGGGIEWRRDRRMGFNENAVSRVPLLSVNNV